MPNALPVAGYVLAGGKSSRMGRDKALVELNGRPLIQHAITKLRDICAEVYILAANAELARYGQLVPDIRPDCGPLGGIEAALQHASRDWVLLVPVDVPFVPAAFLRQWVERVLSRPGAVISYFQIGDRPQPTLLLLRREAWSTIVDALDREAYKLMPALEAVGSADSRVVESLTGEETESWFLNLNSPEDLEVARQRMVQQCPKPDAS